MGTPSMCNFRHFFSRFFTLFLISLLPEIQEIENSKISWRTHKFNPSIIKDPDRLGNPEGLNTIKFFLAFFFEKKAIFGHHRDKMISSQKKTTPPKKKKKKKKKKK